jgi:tyrosyl-tRNA synthetase
MLDFLRDVGKHFTVPYMLAKDSVRSRLDRGLSYTEFSYMLLQAADFEHLYRTMGVELQAGGADQWGNITAGLELIRRTSGAAADAAEGAAGGDGEDLAHGLCYPLLTLPSGEKFGKTADGTSIWLDPEATSPYAFFQYWLNAADADVGRYLRFFTLLDQAEVEALEGEHAAHPERRAAQRRLAADLTVRVHGQAAATQAVVTSEAAFSRDPIGDPAILEILWREADGFSVPPGASASGSAAFLVESGLLPSTSEARRMIAGGAITINGERVASHDTPLPAPIAGEWFQVSIGKKIRRVGRLAH